MTRTLITPPTLQPVTVAEGMAAARQDESHWEAAVTVAIAEGVEIAEHHTGRRIMAQTWRYPLAAWPERADVLPEYQPTNVAVTYRSPVGVWETLASNQYLWAPVEGGIVIVPVAGVTWPAAEPDEFGYAVRVDITVGAQTMGAVPAAFRNFVRGIVELRCGGRYSGKEAEEKEMYLLRGLDALRLYK